MFANHQPHLARHGRRSPAGFVDIATFALLTIRQPLRIACMDFPLVRDGDRKPLFGSKLNGYLYLQSHGASLWERCEHAYEGLRDDDAADCILPIIAEIPSIGLAKAGFIAQMIYGISGCIDTHNIARFGITEKTFYVDKSKPRYRDKLRVMARDYNSFIRRQGGTAALWDGWCEYVANRDPLNYPSAFRVSELHLTPTLH